MSYLITQFRKRHMQNEIFHSLPGCGSETCAEYAPNTAMCVIMRLCIK